MNQERLVRGLKLMTQMFDEYMGGQSVLYFLMEEGYEVDEIAELTSMYGKLLDVVKEYQPIGSR